MNTTIHNGSSRGWFVSLALLAALMFAGCGDSAATYPVSGTVTFEDGSPLTQGTVTFDSGTFSGHGEIGDGGKYSIVGGLVPGSYKVTLGGNALGSYDNPTPLVAQKYASYQTTDIEKKIEAQDNTAVNITVAKP